MSLQEYLERMQSIIQETSSSALIEEDSYLVLDIQRLQQGYEEAKKSRFPVYEGDNMFSSTYAHTILVAFLRGDEWRGRRITATTAQHQQLIDHGWIGVIKMLFPHVEIEVVPPNGSKWSFNN